MEFRVLGPLEMQGTSGVTDLGGPRQRSVLAALLLHANNMVSTSRLVETVWDMPPGTSGSKLRTYVCALRRCLRRSGDNAARLITRPGGYLLRLEPGELDLQRFDELARRGAAAFRDGDYRLADTSFDDALSLWRGEPLDGVPLTSALQAEFARLAEWRAAVREQHIDTRFNLDRPDDLIGELRAFAYEYPLREQAWMRLMLALYRCGRQAEALQTYLEARRTLADGLGVEPGTELRQMQQRILQRDPELTRAPRSFVPAQRDAACPRSNCLPADVPHFVGRAEETERLLARADNVAAPLVCLIDGMPGVGKTSLAVHVAHACAGRCPDIQLFVELNAHQPGKRPTEPADALHTLLTETGVPCDLIPADLAGRAALWRSRLAGRRVVLVLDDASGADQVRPLLPGSPDCLVLITSRSRLPELDVERAVSLDLLDESDAVTMFTELVGAGRGTTELDGAAEVVRLCGCLPLAIRTAASRLRTRPAWRPSELVDRLSGATDRLAELTIGDDGVDTAITSSYRRLAPARQRAFRLLGWHPGADYTPQVAAALTAQPPADAETVLEELLDRNLIVQQTAGRYRMHDLVRCYARRRADLDEPSAERAAALSRLLDSYIAAAEGASLLQHPADDRRIRNTPADRDRSGFRIDTVSDALRWADAEWDNLLTTASQLVTEPDPIARGAIQLVIALHEPCAGRGRYDARINLAKLAGRAAHRVGHTIGEGQSWEDVGFLCARIGRMDESVDYSRQALVIWRAEGNRAGEMSCLTNLGKVYRIRGGLEQARTAIEQAVAIGGRADFPLGAGNALNQLGLVYQQLGRFDDAIACHSRSAAELKELGEPLGTASALACRGWAHQRSGGPALASECFYDALAIFRAFGDLYHTGLVLWGLGQAHHQLHRHERARRCWTESIDILRTVGVVEPDETPTLHDQAEPSPSPAIVRLET